MSSIKFFARATLVAGLLLFGATARGAVVYDLGYDPDLFVGFGQLSIDESCLDREDGVYTSNSENCRIDLLSDHTHDTGGADWGSGLITNVAIDFQIIDGELVRFDSNDNIFLVLLESPGFAGARIAATECGSGQLQFFIPNNLVTFDGCGGLDRGTYFISRASEPESLALVLGGLTVAWVARRRRPRVVS